SLIRRARSRDLNGDDLVALDSERLDLRVDAAVRGSLRNGWSFAEPDGRWTDGPEAALALRARRDEGDLTIDVTAVPMLHPRPPAPQGGILANDGHLAT